jgi:3,4-dihydroxy 2-butanone 4-phosphate synthase/GTP cyclohydrolase II
MVVASTCAWSHDAVRLVSSCRLPTHQGEFTAHVYEADSGIQHVALLNGTVAGTSVLARIHSECLTGETFGSLRCDCAQQLDEALRRINAEGSGIVVYLRGHEGRGIGLGNKLAAYALQDAGLDTVQANEALGLPVDARRFEDAALILRQLGVTSVRLLTNNPHKASTLRSLDIAVNVVPTAVCPTDHNLQYLWTKQQRMGHVLAFPTPLAPDTLAEEESPL